jgi:hypothetical protein
MFAARNSRGVWLKGEGWRRHVSHRVVKMAKNPEGLSVITVSQVEKRVN